MVPRTTRTTPPDGEGTTPTSWRAPTRVLAAARAEATRAGVSLNMLVTTAVSNYLGAPTSPYVQVSGLASVNSDLYTTDAGVSPMMHGVVTTHYAEGLAALDQYANAVSALAGTTEETPCESATATAHAIADPSRSAPTVSTPGSAHAAAVPGNDGATPASPRGTATSKSPRRSSTIRATTRARSTRSPADPPEPKETR